MQCLVDIGLNIEHHCDAAKVTTATKAYEERFISPLVEESRSFVESFACQLPRNLEEKYQHISNHATRLMSKGHLVLVVILKIVLELDCNFCDFLVVLFFSRLKNLLFSYSSLCFLDLEFSYEFFYAELTMVLGVCHLEILFVIWVVLQISQVINGIFLNLKMFQMSMKS